MAAKKKHLWFGFLEAGEKGSPVIRDLSLDTGQSWTMYLFNLRKGRIIEYRRDIAEPKLRELTQEELDGVADMEAAYNLVRPDFIPRAEKRFVPPPRKRARKVDPDPAYSDLDTEIGFFTLDEEGSGAEL
jgi:hypothetical protein